MLEAGDFTYKNRILYPHIERRFHLLEQSVQCSTDITILIDDTGVIVFANSRFENEFDMHITSVIGKPLRDGLSRAVVRFEGTAHRQGDLGRATSHSEVRASAIMSSVLP